MSTEGTEHTHCRAIMRDKWQKITRYEHHWIDKKRSPKKFVDALIEDLKKEFVIDQYTDTCRCDWDGGTEAHVLRVSFNDTEDKLTCTVFSCYCDDFKEGTETPF